MSLSGPTQIAVTSLLFAQLQEYVGAGKVVVSVAEGSTGRDLIRCFATRHPAAEGLLAVSRLAVNCEYASEDVVLRDGDEVAVIPPVSGG